MVGKTEHSETERLTINTEAETTAGTESTVTNASLFSLGRAVYGVVLGVMAFDNVQNLDERIEYANSKGTPMADLSVPMTTSFLLVGSVATVLGRVPKLAAGFIAAFFVSVTPVMHDFWNLDDPQEKQQQQIHFLKNVALLGTAIALAGLDDQSG
ncbi:DoxX family protein [Halostella pelagica]|uniref:DoxX family protein n=1 Tax=Halostella pelagica TaxID=2583824 RepID=UPI001080D1B3|nr:DoxX family protein [Halostella pelagica]